MNSPLNNYYQAIVVYNLIYKLSYKNIFEIPQFQVIYLHINLTKMKLEKERLINVILFFKLLTNKNPLLGRARKGNIFLRIKKNDLINCKIQLQHKQVNFFLEKLIFFVIPYTKHKLKLNKTCINIFNFKLYNIFSFFEFKNEFVNFQNIPPVHVSILTNCQCYSEFLILWNNFFQLDAKITQW